MRIWLLTLMAGLLLTAAGCTARKAVPPDQPATVPPSAQRGPALGHVPVPRTQGHWDATAATPEQAARLFVLGPGGGCECREVTARSVSPGETLRLVRVRLEGLMDDSVGNVEYLVTLRKENGTWKVAAATSLTECRRGVTAEGLCI